MTYHYSAAAQEHRAYRRLLAEVEKAAHAEPTPPVSGTIRIRCSQYDHDGERVVTVGTFGQGGCTACQIEVVSGPIDLIFNPEGTIYQVVPAAPVLAYDARTGRYVGRTAAGQSVAVDSDVFAEALADAIRDGMSPEQAETELLRVSNWQDISPADRGVEE